MYTFVLGQWPYTQLIAYIVWDLIGLVLAIIKITMKIRQRVSGHLASIHAEIEILKTVNPKGNAELEQFKSQTLAINQMKIEQGLKFFGK